MPDLWLNDAPNLELSGSGLNETHQRIAGGALVDVAIGFGTASKSMRSAVPMESTG